MNNLVVWLIILVGSIGIGLIKYYAANTNEEKKSKVFNFNEIFNHTLSIFLGLLIVYYFVSIRYPLIMQIGTIQVTDLILLFIFAMCLLGWMPYFIGNITKSIHLILAKVLK